MNQPRNVFILGVSSDIGRKLALQYLERGDYVVGTYRNSSGVSELLSHPRATLFQVGIQDHPAVQSMADELRAKNFTWDIFISAIGTLEPIGDFFQCNFNEWEESIRSNSLGQLRVLHALHALRRKPFSHVGFFAGGGTNNAVAKFSAYTASKIFLIKMCELLDEENPDMNIFIVGPGWVNTKIHQQVIESGANAGKSYERTLEFLNQPETGTPQQNIYDCIEWCIDQGRAVSGGRNFSVVHDPWGDQALADALRQNSSQFKLRRFSNLSDLGKKL